MAGLSQATPQAGIVSTNGVSTGFNSAAATVGPTDPLSSNPLGAGGTSLPEGLPGGLPILGPSIAAPPITGNVAAAGSNVLEATKSIGDLTARLFDPTFWKGTGLIVIGGVVAVIGLMAFFRKGQSINISTPSGKGAAADVPEVAEAAV